MPVSCCPTATNYCGLHLTRKLNSTSTPSISPALGVLSCRFTQQFSSSHLYGGAIIMNRPLMRKHKGLKVVSSKKEPLKVMISGAPASGKGTQCEMIAQKFGLVHLSTDDILSVEVAASTEIGIRAKEYMNSGRLVPDEIVTAMVTSRLSLQDVKEKGWLLDGYPQNPAQAQSLEKLNIRPDVYITLDVSEDILIDRCVGRRLDPLTGRIYHIKKFPTENEEIKARLVTRSDDIEEMVKSRLKTYKQNSESILSTYSNVIKKIDGNRPKEVVFEEIESILSRLQKSELASDNQLVKSSFHEIGWRGIPTRLNNIPHSREIRKYFYQDVLQATQRAVKDGKTRLKVEINIPELNPEMDVYRIGTLMELVRILALSFADDGKYVKVCVQGSMGEGSLAGMPLQLAGTRKILEFMDWGDDGAIGTFIKIGSIGGKEVEEQDDMFILVAPQNAVGNCIIDVRGSINSVTSLHPNHRSLGAILTYDMIYDFVDGTMQNLKAMTAAAAHRPVILINPRLKDLPGSSGIMQTMGRDKRLEYAASFEICYHFRLLYYAGTQYPIMGALRMAYPYDYELYKRVDESPQKEKYVTLSKFPSRPSGEEINDAFDGKTRSKADRATGIWGFLSSIFMS